MVETRSIDVVAQISGGTIDVISSTTDVFIKASYIMLPTDIQAHYYTSTVLFSSTVVANAGTVTSGTCDISNYLYKTVSLFITGTGSTYYIETAPESSGTLRTYSSSEVPSATFTTESFTENFNDFRLTVVSGAASSTISAWLGLMA